MHVRRSPFWAFPAQQDLYITLALAAAAAAIESEYSHYIPIRLHNWIHIVGIR